jgi:DNA-binding NarL/FixJ family response regulator
MKILLADDHGLFLEGLNNLLRAGGYTVVGMASDGLEAVRQARSLHPDVILMDIRMPRCDGLTATRVIQAELPEIKIVMLTTSTKDADLFEALRSGASGYLLKNLKPNELFDFLAGLSQGEAALSRELSARVLAEFAHQAAQLNERDAQGLPDAAEIPELTSRQREILGMVAEG